MERQPLGKLAPAQPHGASSLRPAHLGPPPASDAAPVKRGRGRPPGAKNKKTLLLEAMMGGEPRNAFTPTPGSRPLDSALSAPLSAPSLSMPSWDSLGRASPSPVPTGVVPQTATRAPKPAPAPAPIPVGTVVDRVAASALRQVSHRFVDLRDVVKRAREESAAVDEWRYGAMRRVDAAEEAAEDEATRRLRRNAALMAEVMTPVSNDDDDDSSKNDRSKADSSREETLDTRVARLRAAVASSCYGGRRWVGLAVGLRPHQPPLAHLTRRAAHRALRAQSPQPRRRRRPDSTLATSCVGAAVPSITLAAPTSR